MTTCFSIDDAQKALQKYWKYANFRARQGEVIKTLSTSTSAVALLPTGGGKSLCYQVPATVLPGLTIVVSPLISLMEDQVQALKGIGVKAEAIHSGLTKKNVDRILDNCLYGAIKLLYVAPERLGSPIFQERMRRIEISLLAVDEAHCISQWGHNFRPSYLEVGNFIEAFGPKQVLAVTATATPKVEQDIKKYLDIEDAPVIRDSFKRDNLSIYIHHTEDKVNDIISLVKGLKTIIYARNRRMVRMLAKSLQSAGISAEHYHAGLSFKEKKEIQARFQSDRLQVVVATNAFGMGIDVGNIRQVIHHDLPPSLEEYYQEIGRAGRDGAASDAVLLLAKADLTNAEKRLTSSYPPFEQIARIYKAVHVRYQIGIGEGESRLENCDMAKLSEEIRIKVQPLLRAMKAWQHVGIWEMTRDDRTRIYIKIIASPRELRDQMHRLSGAQRDVVELWMRRYEHLFDGWSQIELTRDTRKLGISEETYEGHIDGMIGQGLIKKYKTVSGPKLRFLANRESSKYLERYEHKYHMLKEMEVARWRGISEFVSSDRCRMVSIMEYFGEQSAQPCGQCDHCRAKASDGLDASKIEASDLLYQRKKDERHG